MLAYDIKDFLGFLEVIHIRVETSSWRYYIMILFRPLLKYFFLDIQKVGQNEPSEFGSSYPFPLFYRPHGTFGKRKGLPYCHKQRQLNQIWIRKLIQSVGMKVK